MKAATGVALVLAALIGGILARELWPRTDTVYRQGPTVTDTVYVRELSIDTIIERRTVVVSDTVRIAYEVLISDPVTYDCPDLPQIRGIERLTAGHSFDDTTRVAIVDVRPEGSQIAVQREVQSLWTPGPITYLEASDPLRVDFGEWPDEDGGCDFLCRLDWALLGFVGGVITWELVR